MTYEQYWYGDPLMVRVFWKANKLRQKREDEMAWLHGLYMQRALLSTVGNMFLEEGDQPFMYPEIPIMEEQEKERAEERRAKEAERERMRLVAYLNRVMETRKQRER